MRQAKWLGAMMAMLMAGGGLCLAQEPVSHLQAVCRDGQVFLTWREHPLPPGATLKVYSHAAPITDASRSQAVVLAEHIHPHSARDWWRDRASFDKNAPKDEPVGFVIETGGAELPPDGGLHVHTVRPDVAGARFYAVTAVSADGREDALRLGVNSLSSPVTASVAQRSIVWLDTPEKAPRQGSAKGKALVLSLHGRGGGRPRDNSRAALNCLYFADATQGWREGLPFKFQLSVYPDRIQIAPQERIWVGRPVLESRDARDHCPTAQSFYTGYNTQIWRSIDTPELVVDLYQERYLLGLMDWAQRWLGTDPNRTYLTGTSMGGSGSVSMALHYPDRIAAVLAHVPIYAYTWRKGCNGGTSASRLLCMVGPVNQRPARLTDGRDLLDYLDGVKAIGHTTPDMPPIFATNGRMDGSIPWANNPPFYTAAQQARQALAVYWNNGDHSMSSQAPADVKDWSRLFRSYRLDASYPVFTHNSDDRNYGNGDWKDGDLVGWLNRGLSWNVLADQPDSYAIQLAASHPDITYPVRFDLTLRRRQRFLVKPGDRLNVSFGPDSRTLTIPADGLLTIPGLTLPNATPVTLTLTLIR